MKIVLRPERAIYRIDGGWFKARWHFSFDRYDGPNNMGIGTLRVFNHDTLAPGAVWPMHAHRDVEGITYVVANCDAHPADLAPGLLRYQVLRDAVLHRSAWNGVGPAPAEPGRRIHGSPV